MSKMTKNLCINGMCTHLEYHDSICCIFYKYNEYKGVCEYRSMLGNCNCLEALKSIEPTPIEKLIEILKRPCTLNDLREALLDYFTDMGRK